jgi:hypothetical protein
MNRLNLDDPHPSDDALDRLHRAGWSIGDVAFHDGAGGLDWRPRLSDENLIRAEGTTRDEECPPLMAVGGMSL